MKSKLKLIPTFGMGRQEWLSFRTKGIGASEVGTVLGLDDYKSSLELYYQKIGATPTFDTETMAKFMGLRHEDLIAELWQFWENDEETMIRNYQAGNIVRRCQRVNAYVSNPDYPWLFVSLDRKINKTAAREEGTLELKTISGYEADKWESNLPPKYITQVNCQMLVCEFEFGEMAILQDGRKLSVLPFEASRVIQEHIIKKTMDFWDRVIQGRKYVNEKYVCLQEFNQRRVDELDHEIDKLAPEPDGTLVYANYLKEKFGRPLEAERRGTASELLEAQNQRENAERMKEIQEKKLLAENRLKMAMGDKFQMLDFGAEGRVYWSKQSDGKRVFRNKIKS